MMQGVDPIPPANPGRDTVTPIVGEIENGEVGDERDGGPRSKYRDRRRKRRRRDAVSLQKSVQALTQPIEFEVRYERKQDDADEKRIANIGSDGIAFRPAGYGPKMLQGRTDQKADGQFGESACRKEHPQGSRVAGLPEAKS